MVKHHIEVRNREIFAKAIQFLFFRQTMRNRETVVAMMS